jgi:hypothetical protein
MRAVPVLIVRSVRAVRILGRDGRIPRPVRLFVAVGLVPLPGPFDEAVLVLGALILFVFYRQAMRDAWHEAATGRGDRRSSV